MIYDSHQGTKLSSGQRAQIQQRVQVRSFINPVLAQSIAETIKELEVRKEQGAKPEKIWFLDRSSSWNGTISVAEWMGY
jgi:hypothetical protein